jgi:predicted porin
MQKKLLAIAVAGALAPAAAMAQSTVEIYGRANIGVDYWQAKGSDIAGADFKGRVRVFDSASRLGFRINESLGGGMRAFVVIESGVNIDSGSGNGQSGAANASTGFWASRDSYAGIGGDWGDIRFGRQSPYYGNGIISQAGSNYINQAVDNVFSFNHFIQGPTGREPNVLSYNSPTIGGFNASVSWGPGRSEGAAYTGNGGQKKESLWAFTGRYTGGPLRAQFDFAKRSNVSNVSGQDITGWKVGAGWAYAPGSQISFITGNHKNENLILGVGLGDVGFEQKQQLNIVNLEHMMGQWQLIAQFMFTGKIKSDGDVDDTKSKGFTLAAKYFLSKRTGVYASFNQIKNESLAIMDFSNAGYSSTALIAPGADPRIFALGVMHNF